MSKILLVISVLIFAILTPWLTPIICGGLQQDIATAPYDTTQYKLHTFDCTDMSGLMETHLTAKGWDARIQVYTDTGIVGHAMVIVYDHTNYSCTLVETTRKAATTQYPHGMKLEAEYEDIIDAAENSRWGASDWGLEHYLQQRSITERKGGKPCK